MEHDRTIAAIALVACALNAGSAAADITADQVWAAIQSYGESAGQSFSGTPSRSGDTLTVSDLTFSMDTPEARARGTFGELTLTEMGDGTVTLSVPPAYGMTVSIEPETGEAVTMAMNVRQTALSTIVSGTPENITYDFSADDVEFDIADLIVDGEPVDMDLTMSLGGLAGQYVQSGSELRNVTAALKAASGKLLANIVDPEGNGSVRISADVADITSSSSSTLPDGADTTDMSAMLKAGFATDARVTYGALGLDADFADGSETARIVGSAEGGTLAVAMSGQSLTYGGTQSGLAVSVSGSEIPLPEISGQIAETAFNLTMPLAQTDSAADFALLASYKGVAVSDLIWSMFDPGGALPRDPANIVLDLAGRGRWLVDIMDPEMAENFDAPPAELEAVDINALELTVAGASLTGDGAFAFDNTDMTTFPGMPAPSGSANLRLTGAEGLMDTLVQMGLVQEEQVMSLRLMLGLFARPGEGEDTLVSEIVVNEDGSILANGQRLK